MIINPPFLPCREQLTRCREHVSDLLSQKTSLEAQISEREEARHMAALGMLRSQVAKVKSEIGAEELVEQDIQVLISNVT